ncbi:MAG: hypothetical protein JJU13_11895 [Balneolaceae bacterium]|nr:hypothetical protein [Balneolaceae bacterium]
MLNIFATYSYEKKYLIVTILLITIFGCNKEKDNTLLFDYSDVKKIDAEVIIEIAESENFIPGHLRDLILIPGGTLLVSDWGNNTIEQFSEQGKHMGTVAKGGRGPGEITSFVQLFKGPGDSLMVRHRGMFSQVDFFARNKNDDIYRYEKTKMFEGPGERYIHMIGQISDNKFLATARHNTPSLQLQTEGVENYDFVPVAAVDPGENIFRDSLYILKVPNPETDFEERFMNVIGMPPYQHQDRLRIMPDGQFLIGRPDSSMLYIYNYNNHYRPERKVPVQAKRRPVEKEDLDYKFRDRNRDARSRLEARVPKYKPPILDFWVSESQILLHTDTNESGKEMLILSMEGDPSGRFSLSEFDDIRYFKGNRIYTLHIDPDSGHSIRIYQVELL